MDNTYYLKQILKQIKFINISLLVSLLTFIFIDINEVVALIVFSILIASIFYRLINIRMCLEELFLFPKTYEEVEDKEQVLISCTNTLNIDNDYDFKTIDNEKDKLNTEENLNTEEELNKLNIEEVYFDYVMEED